MGKPKEYTSCKELLLLIEDGYIPRPEMKGSLRTCLNEMARSAAKQVGLKADERREFHDLLHIYNNPDLTYEDLVTLAHGIKTEQ